MNHEEAGSSAADARPQMSTKDAKMEEKKLKDSVMHSTSAFKPFKRTEHLLQTLKLKRNSF